MKRCEPNSRIHRKSADCVEWREREAREEAERRQADFARRLRTDPTVIYSSEDTAR